MEEALAALERPGARLYAGGTDLLIDLHHDSPFAGSVRELVDIKGIAEARGIRTASGALHVGSLTTAAELEGHELVARHARALQDAASRTSAPMLRARGTVGGNLLARHPAPDMATALLALEATVRVAVAPQDVRDVPVETVMADPGVYGGGDDRARPSIVLGVEIETGARSAFMKLGTRRAFSRARLAGALSIRGSVHRVVFGGLWDRPRVARQMSAALDADGDPVAALGRDLDATDGARERLRSSGRSARQLADLVDALLLQAVDRAAPGAVEGGDAR